MVTLKTWHAQELQRYKDRATAAVSALSILPTAKVVSSSQTVLSCCSAQF